MNASPSSKFSWGVYLLGGMGVLLIMAAVVQIAIREMQPLPVGQRRADERRKNMADLRQSNMDVLNNYAWMDQPKGVVRIPIEQAMELMRQEWQNPADGRKKLLARIEKATAVAPNAYE